MKKSKIVQFILIFSGIISILYSIALNLFISATNIFHYFFIFFGIFLIVLSCVIRKIQNGTLQIPKGIRLVFRISCMVGVLIFIILEGVIIGASVRKPPENLDYLIILGAGLRGDRPSLTLAYRLDKAYEYMLINENTIAVVSGGQGFDEVIPEAEAMANYLMDKGIPKERILLEKKSTSTYENLKFSKELISSQNTDFSRLSIGVVTNNFHIFRALHLAKDLSYENVYGCSAKSLIWLMPNNYIREAFAVIKDCILN